MILHNQCYSKSKDLHNYIFKVRYSKKFISTIPAANNNDRWHLVNCRLGKDDNPKRKFGAY